MTIFSQNRELGTQMSRWITRSVHVLLRVIWKPRAALSIQTSIIGDFAKQEVIIITIRNLRATPLNLKGVASVSLGALYDSEYVRVPSRTKPLHKGDIATHFYYPDQILGQTAILENIAYIFAYDERGKQYQLRIASLRRVYWHTFLRRLSQQRLTIRRLIKHQVSWVVKRRTY